MNFIEIEKDQKEKKGTGHTGSILRDNKEKIYTVMKVQK